MVDYITTVAKAKVYMKKTDATDDALLLVLVKSATGMIQNFLNRDIVGATYSDEIYDGTGMQELFLRQYPITSVTHVKLYDPVNDTDIYTYEVKSEYIIHNLQEYVIMWMGWSKGWQKFKITYVAGYTVSGEDSAIPADIELAANMLVSYMFNGIGVQGLKSWRAGSYSETRADVDAKSAGIPPEVMGILEIHRRPVI